MALKRSAVRKRRPGPPRKGPMRSEKYRRWVSQHLCCVCFGCHPMSLEAESFSQACHTENNGGSSKGPDSSCVPLCVEHHVEYDAGRKALEKKHGVNMKEIAAQYYSEFVRQNSTKEPCRKPSKGSKI
jgi:hypothetical protein